VAKQMKAYEDLLYEQWRQQVEATLPTLLKRNLLALPDAAATSVKFDVSTSDAAEKAHHADGNTKFFADPIVLLHTI